MKLENIIIFIFLLIVLAICIFFIWRFLSKYYELPCPSWLGWLVEMENPFCKYNRSKIIVSELEIQRGMTILDLGCGPGRVTLPLSKEVGAEGKVVALDVQLEMLKKIQKKLLVRDLSSNVIMLNAKIGDSLFKNCIFDRILLVNVLGEVVDKNTVLNKIFTTLKTDGILSITEIIFDPHFQNQKKVLRFVEDTEFKVLKILGNSIGYTIHLGKK
ncbi:MAG: class I SAM-dependent methyltransferase [Legionellales bacterium]|nr:class I SAM-dependent methyltransferase [Legionellales bacterium]